MGVVERRAELLFLYDIKDANPNGDPADENKPRIDEETGINIVTDVRLKRTIRDYLFNFKGQEIFIRDTSTEGEGRGIKDAKERAKDFGNDPGRILGECIDIRLFGGTIPITKGGSKGSSITLTGPVQFRMGRSLHKVEVRYIMGTGAFASTAGAEQKTFREEYVLPYSLICFYGVINENAAKHTNLTEEDVLLMLEGMWEGTKNLISRSKFGQMPRLLLRVNYREDNYHIGDLDKLIKIESDKTDEELRNITDLKIDLTDLISKLRENSDKIESINYKKDDSVKFILDGRDVSLEEALREVGVEIEEITY